MCLVLCAQQVHVCVVVAPGLRRRLQVVLARPRGRVSAQLLGEEVLHLESVQHLQSLDEVFHPMKNRKIDENKKIKTWCFLLRGLELLPLLCSPSHANFFQWKISKVVLNRPD